MLASLGFRRTVLVGMAGVAMVAGTGCKKEQKKPAVDPTTAVFEA